MSLGLRIAVADDEPEMREYFRRALCRLGHTVVGTAQSGLELVDLCRLHHPDLVITDIKMPGLSGIDATRLICREQRIAVLLVSAHHNPGPLDRVLEEHLVDHVTKPIRQADLTAALALARQRLQEMEMLHKVSGSQHTGVCEASAS